MFYVQTVIHNFRQIQILNPDLSANLRSRILHLAMSRGGRDESDKSGALVVSFNSERERAFTLLSDFLFTTKDILDQSSDLVRGYTLVVEPLEGDQFSVLRRLQETFLLTREENGIWTCLGASLFRKNGLPLQDLGGIYGLAGPLREQKEDQLGWKEAARQFSWAQDLDRIALGSVPQVRITSDKSETLAYLYRWFSGNRQELPPPSFFYRPGTMLDFPGPLVMGLDPGLTASLPEGLPAEEAEIWKENQYWRTLLGPWVLNFQGDSLDMDLLKAMTFWFRSARMLRRESPKVLILQDPCAWARHTREIMERVLETEEIRRNWTVILVETPGSESFRPADREIQLDWTSLTLLPGGLDRREAFPFFFRLLSDAGKDGLPGTLLEAPRVLKTLLVIDRCSGLLKAEDVISILEASGEDPLVMEDVLVRLEEEGLILSPHGLILANPQWNSRHLLSREDIRTLEVKMGPHLYRKWLAEGKPHSEAYAGLLFSLGFPGEALTVLESYLDHRIAQVSWESGVSAGGEAGIPDHGDFLQVLRRRLPHDIPAPWKDQLILVAASAKLRFALGQAPRFWESRHLGNFTKNFTPTTLPESSGEWLLQSGRFHLAVDKPNEGFTMIKKAYMASQGLKNPSLQIRSGIELGLVLLRRGRASEAWEYFDMAGRLAQTQGHTGDQYRAGLYEAAARILWGNVSGGLDVLDSLKDLPSETGLHSWEVFHRFLEGRSHFELGRYEESEKAFDRGISDAAAHLLPRAGEVCIRWKARSLVYRGRVREGQKILQDLPAAQERNFFLAEARYFSGDFSGALELLNPEEKPERYPMVQGRLYWDSGFSLLEDLCAQEQSEQTLLSVVMSGFRAHVLGSSGKMEEALEILQTVTSGKHLPVINPYLPLLLFWWASLMSRRGSGPEAFHSTILGKGFKELQTRGSRLQNREDRHSYLQRAYWNAAYIAEARKYKLV